MTDLHVPQKSTLVGVALAAIVLYAAKQELPTLTSHPFHTSLIAFFLVLAIALILNDDARILKLLMGVSNAVRGIRTVPAVESLPTPVAPDEKPVNDQ